MSSCTVSVRTSWCLPANGFVLHTFQNLGIPQINFHYHIMISPIFLSFSKKLVITCQILKTFWRIPSNVLSFLQYREILDYNNVLISYILQVSFKLFIHFVIFQVICLTGPYSFLYVCLPHFITSYCASSIIYVGIAESLMVNT